MLIFLLLICFIIIQIYPKSGFNENFDVDQTHVPKDQPAGLSWNFESLKSSIKNYNETTEIHQDLNNLRGYSSSLIGLNQPRPNWIYPYTFLNREWDRILLDLTIQIEKGYNNNRMLEQSNNIEWQKEYPYVEVKWDIVPNLVQNIILDVVGEINRRFNVTPPSVDFKRDSIKYHWINYNELIVKINVYKAYTACDIEYDRDLGRNTNNDLKMDFEKELLIYIDQLDNNRRYHLKYLRFPDIAYNHKDGLENLRSDKEFDNLFYLARSKDFYYRTFSNTEARDQYLLKVKEEKEKSKYKCFGQENFIQQSLQQTDDRTSCELANGYWDKQCEQDSDCPYYMGNKNYPNTFGGCNKKTGFCTWPAGMESFSYRIPRNPEQALCYNCSNGNLGSFTMGKCCVEQKDTRNYANLLTPDYAYINDTSQRFKYRDLFDRYNLNWSKFT